MNNNSKKKKKKKAHFTLWQTFRSKDVLGFILYAPVLKARENKISDKAVMHRILVFLLLLKSYTEVREHG